ncbi:MAG: 2-C-methyl-D-erythritol 4-phosphate cytidylyltransferase [Desulfatibacillaceae bacterium]
MIAAVIVAGGSGLRMGGDTRKQYMELNGRPILSHTLAAFDRVVGVDRIVLVVPAEDMDYCENRIVPNSLFAVEARMVAGGAHRQESAYNGLLEAEGAEIVAIHDGVRPFVTTDQIEKTIETARSRGAATLAVRAHDTIKRVDRAGKVLSTLDRNALWLAQTPQAFRYDIIRQAHEKARNDRWQGSDDAVLVERMGHPVHVVEGSRRNIKITTPEDLEMAAGVSLC